MNRVTAKEAGHKVAKKKKSAKKRQPASARTTKTDRVIEMLRAGATPEFLMKATGWQAHSLRGFISGTLRKKLGLTVTLEDGKYTATGGGK
jgi:hypothetical protein